MLYAIVSDVHANLAAWKVVLTDLTDLKADRIICLGDVVGYGPDPVEVLESVYRHVHVTLMGNHDAVGCGVQNDADFSPRAKQAIRGQRKLLSPAAILWLRKLPFVHAEAGFRCTHGSFEDPKSFHYIIEPRDALASWESCTEQLMFVGHTHMPGIYVIGASGTPHFLPPFDFILEEGKRYIVNPGSVGYPRVGDCRSSYCLYNSETKEIRFRQLPFDTAGYQEAIAKRGWGNDGWLEAKERGRHIMDLREQPAFGRREPAPKPRLGESAAPATAEPSLPKTGAILRQIWKRLHSWIWLTGIALGLCVAVALILAFWAGRSDADASFAIEIPPYEMTTMPIYPLTPPDKNFLPPWPTVLDAEGRLIGWRYKFEDKTRQRLSTGLRDQRISLLVTHTQRQKVRIESALINLAGTELKAARLRIRILKGEAFEGTLRTSVDLYAAQEDGNYALLRRTPFELSRKGKDEAIVEVNRKIPLLKKTSHLRFAFEGDFTGRIEILPPYLGQAIDAPSRQGQGGNPSGGEE